MTVCIDKESSYLHGDDMDNDNGNQCGNLARFFIFILTVFLTITAFVIVRPFQASGGAPATVATYSHGLLHLTIAYHAARSARTQCCSAGTGPRSSPRPAARPPAAPSRPSRSRPRS